MTAGSAPMKGVVQDLAGKKIGTYNTETVVFIQF